MAAPIQSRTVIRFSPRVSEGVTREVLAAFNAVPKRGAETGGLLLGRRGPDEVYVRDFEPVLCSHRFGPSFRLDDADLEGFEETVAWFAEAGQQELEVVGSYRSHTRAARELDEQDRQWIKRCGGLFLLLEPSRNQTIQAHLFTRRGEEARPVAAELPFPIQEDLQLDCDGVALAPKTEEPAPVAAPVEPPPRADTPEAVEPLPVPEPAPPPAPEPSHTPEPPRIDRRPLPPPLPKPEGDAPPERWTGPLGQRPDAALPRAPRLLPPEREPRRWLVPAALLLLMTAAGAYMGYRSARPPGGQSAETPAPAATRAPEADPEAVPPPPSVAATPPESTPAQPAASADRVEADAAPVAPDVRRALDGWARALRSGNPRTAASFYAPRVARYGSRINLSNAEVQRAISDAIVRRGVPIILRIDDVRVETADASAAVIVFRRHWQTRGPGASAGEEQVRMRFVRARGKWKIALEEEPRIYWTHGRR